ncbi:ORC-CDC6 family AAA ATPase [Geminicoccus harenae]|uniref:ORC-CDC6 family AAA ATPase n=1 Tax=Geminicoccus harenae TaxID=2498453 RepID=UPI00168B4BED|nr:hypothetical protein [Geminicoccus harenae]
MSDNERILAIHKVLLGFTQRAERATEETLIAPFVDSPPMFNLLSTKNNQIVFGRRGTGKTHALKFMSRQILESNERPIYIDLRLIGSNGSIYSDDSRSFPERASSLIIDVLKHLYNDLVELALEKIDAHPHPGEITTRIDALYNAISTVRVIGSTEHESNTTTSSREMSGLNVGVSIGATASGNAAFKAESTVQKDAGTRIKHTGKETAYLTFGNIGGPIESVLAILNAPRIWILIDEWSEVPIDLQPYLADLLRRTIPPINGITLKIAAIEHRFRFSIIKDQGEYIGLELSADLSADLNLDDFLVFDNNQHNATNFFKTLIFKHYESADPTGHQFRNSDEFIQAIFTQFPVFEEFVRAVEGVPRDALNLAAKVATKSYGRKITMNDVHAAARDWYNQEKATSINNDTNLSRLLGVRSRDVV